MRRSAGRPLRAQAGKQGNNGSSRTYILCRHASPHSMTRGSGRPRAACVWTACVWGCGHTPPLWPTPRRLPPDGPAPASTAPAKGTARPLWCATIAARGSTKRRHALRWRAPLCDARARTLGAGITLRAPTTSGTRARRAPPLLSRTKTRSQNAYRILGAIKRPAVSTHHMTRLPGGVLILIFL